MIMMMLLNATQDFWLHSLIILTVVIIYLCVDVTEQIQLGLGLEAMCLTYYCLTHTHV